MNPTIKFNIVFDIDNVLADTYVGRKEEIKFFQRKGYVLTAVKTHYVFPGVIEMMQLLFKMPDVKVSFFSSGHQSRNELFVKHLLERALGEEHYLKIKEDIKILSGKKDEGLTDLIYHTNEEIKMQREKYGESYGSARKSLEKFIEKEEDLKNCVLIDDDSTYVKYGQEENYLHVPVLRTYDFMNNSWSEKPDENGQERICFRKLHSFSDIQYYKNIIMNADSIGIFLKEEKCTLVYSNLSQDQCDQIEILKKNDKKLFKALKKYYLEKQEDLAKIMTEDEFKLAIYTLIEKKNGKTKKLQLNCNRICYVAGLLFKALEQARSNSSLTQFLFPLHFSAKDDSTFKPRFGTDQACYKKEEYYHYGLEKLKEANPAFSFINTNMYEEYCQMKISEKEEADIQALYENQVVGCCVM